METLKTVKNRIHSISSTRQITESMRTVSIIKMGLIRDRMDRNRPFVNETLRLVRTAAGDLTDSHPYTAVRKVERTGVVVIAADRGLCGGYNVNIGKETAQLIQSEGDCKLVTVGVKARDYCGRRWKDMVAHSFTYISESPFYEDAQEISRMVVKWYDDKEVDQVYLVHTNFVNMLIQNPRAVKLLPFDSAQPGEAEAEAKAEPGIEMPMRYEEPGTEALLQKAVPFYVTAAIYGAMLESSLCEQSARASGMEAAVKNADEMIEKLTLMYNQARQSAITQEITEIISGAESL